MTKYHPGAEMGASVFKQHTKDNAATSITFAADKLGWHVIEFITALYDNTAANKDVLVTVGGTEVWRGGLLDRSGDHFTFAHFGLYAGKNEALVITLAASGTGGTTGRLSVGVRSDVVPTTN